CVRVLIGGRLPGSGLPTLRGLPTRLHLHTLPANYVPLRGTTSSNPYAAMALDPRLSRPRPPMPGHPYVVTGTPVTYGPDMTHPELEKLMQLTEAVTTSNFSSMTTPRPIPFSATTPRAGVCTPFVIIFDSDDEVTTLPVRPTPPSPDCKPALYGYPLDFGDDSLDKDLSVTAESLHTQSASTSVVHSPPT
ncbi:hypothetical protein Tco_0550799, partial [Tanacetum coccineum]